MLGVDAWEGKRCEFVGGGCGCMGDFHYSSGFLEWEEVSEDVVYDCDGERVEPALTRGVALVPGGRKMRQRVRRQSRYYCSSGGDRCGEEWLVISSTASPSRLEGIRSLHGSRKPSGVHEALVESEEDDGWTDLADDADVLWDGVVDD